MAIRAVNNNTPRQNPVEQRSTGIRQNAEAGRNQSVRSRETKTQQKDRTAQTIENRRTEAIRTRETESRRQTRETENRQVRTNQKARKQDSNASGAVNVVA